MTTEHQSEPEAVSWAEFWGERRNENVELLDAFCGRLALSICELEHRNAVESTDQQHGPQRHDGTPCDSCFGTAVDLMWGFLAEAFQIFGKRAYEAGRAGESELTAAELSVTGIGHFAQAKTNKVDNEPAYLAGFRSSKADLCALAEYYVNEMYEERWYKLFQGDGGAM